MFSFKLSCQVFLDRIQRFKRFKNSKVQEFKNSRLLARVKDSKKIWWFLVFLCLCGERYKDSKDSKIQKFKNSKIQGFRSEK